MRLKAKSHLSTPELSIVFPQFSEWINETKVRQLFRGNLYRRDQFARLSRYRSRNEYRDGPESVAFTMYGDCHRYVIALSSQYR